MKSNIVVPYIDLSIDYKDIGEYFLEIKKVFDSGQFIMGDFVELFEKEVALLCNTKYAVGVGNGTDALEIILESLNIGHGDEVITVSNSFIATVSCIMRTKATPVFVDVKYDLTIDETKIEEKITNKTKAILPVHLTGTPANMNTIMSLSKTYNLNVIEDCAQAICSKLDNIHVGNFGVAGALSLHPLKNLNAVGDAGVIITNNKLVYDKVKLIRNHGLKNRNESILWGRNSRLDAIQAAILLKKIKNIEELTRRRRKIASIYDIELKDYVITPKSIENSYSVYHTYIIRCKKREELAKYLLQCGIETKVHYPIPVHLQKAARSLGYEKGSLPIVESFAEEILSLPIYPQLEEEQISYVINCIKEFYKNGRWYI